MRKFVIVDIETTGNSPKNGDRSIQFAAVVIEDLKIIDTYSTYLNPEKPIPAFISELTGIGDDQVQTAPVFKEVAKKIMDLFSDSYFVAHNVFFDWNFLQEELKHAGFPSLTCPLLDTVEMSKILYPTLDSYHLNDIAIFAGFDHNRPHQADSDAYVTAEWFITLMEKLNSLPLPVISRLMELAKLLKSDLYSLLHTIYLEKNVINEKPDHQLVLFRGLTIRKPDPYKAAEGDLSAGRNIITAQNPYVSGDIAANVYTALQNKEISLVEMNIRDSKLSYLLPAVHYSFQTGRRVVLSVHSVQEQFQMMDILIPKAEKMLNEKISVHVLKGKSNYLNLWKFEKFLQKQSEHYDETIMKMQILVWLLETESGDRDELNLSGAALLLWDKVSAGSLEEGLHRNPWEEREFYNISLEKARKANLIITTHSFLLADLTNPRPMLPNYEKVIIDGTLDFLNNAGNFFGNRLNYQRLRFMIGQLGNIDQMKLLGRIHNLVDQWNLPFHSQIEDIQVLLDHFSTEADDFFQICVSMNKEHGFLAGAGKRYLQLTKNLPDIFFWALERFYHSYQQLFLALEKLLDNLFANHHLSEKGKLIQEELSKFLNQFYSVEHLIDDLSNPDRLNISCWVEYETKNPYGTVKLYSHPIFVHENLWKTTLMKNKSVLFLSGAFTVNNSFSFILEELGIGKMENQSVKLYRNERETEAIRLYVFNDLPKVNRSSNLNFEAKISNHIAKIAEAAQGKVFVLFHSFEMLKNTYRFLKEEDSLFDFLLLAQGVTAGSPHRLLKQFKRFDKVVLIGFNTLIDRMDEEEIEDLAAVIFVRLPFTAPNNPLHSGKIKRLRENGKNPFYDYSLPQAVLRFKQNLGQILRITNNHCKLIILDNRIEQSQYGKYFLQSTPNSKLYKVSIGELCDEIAFDRKNTEN